MSVAKRVFELSLSNQSVDTVTSCVCIVEPWKFVCFHHVSCAIDAYDCVVVVVVVPGSGGAALNKDVTDCNLFPAHFCRLPHSSVSANLRCAINEALVSQLKPYAMMFLSSLVKSNVTMLSELRISMIRRI